MLKCKRFEKEIVKNGVYYLDQLNEKEDIWITGTWLNKYLKEHYNINSQQYYNIIKYNNINYKQYCVYCKIKEVKWKGLGKGYDDFCSQSCITKYRLQELNKLNKNPFQNKEFIENNRNRVSEFQKSKLLNGTHQFLTKESKIKSAINSYISKNKTIKSNLYIGVCKELNCYKIGVSKNPYNRKSTQYKNYKIEYQRIVRTDLIYKCLEIEKEIKLKYCFNDSEFLIKNITKKY